MRSLCYDINVQLKAFTVLYRKRFELKVAVDNVS